MADNNVTDQSLWNPNSPYFKAFLAASMQPQGTQGQGQQPPMDDTAPSPASTNASSLPASMPVQPQSKLSDRIEDDRTAGTRGTTPQADLGSRYAGASYHAQDPAKLIREQQITKDTTALNRMNTPTKQSLGQNILSIIGRGIAGAGAGYTHQLPQL